MLKTIIKRVSTNNFIRRHAVKKMRRELVNTNASFLTPNCIGGILFHDLGLKFMSPTVNLMMTQRDFLLFVLHLDDYLNGTFHFFEHEEYTCPCAKLSPMNGEQEITVHFTHYHSQEEALQKWEERKHRIDKNNLFILIEERDGISKEELSLLSNLRVKGIVAFSCNEYPDLPYTVCLSKYTQAGEVGNILQQSHLTGKREYEKFFDFVKWFNEADGYPYNVSPFVK